jgi:uncharacterized protein (DUF1778 family)
MKARWSANTARLNCKIRPDIKAALEALAAKWHQQECGQVGLTRVIYEAAVMLLRREGIVLKEPPATAPVVRPTKTLVRRKRRSEIAVGS